MHASAEIGRPGTYVQRNAVGLDPQPQMLQLSVKHFYAEEWLLRN
jgi:hypothetical protein